MSNLSKILLDIISEHINSYNEKLSKKYDLDIDELKILWEDQAVEGSPTPEKETKRETKKEN